MELSLKEDVKSVITVSKKGSNRQADSPYFKIEVRPGKLNTDTKREFIFNMVFRYIFKSANIANRGMCYLEDGMFTVYVELENNSRLRMDGNEKVLINDNEIYRCMVYDKARIPIDFKTSDSEYYYFMRKLKVNGKEYLKSFDFENGDKEAFISAMVAERKGDMLRFGKQIEENFDKYFYKKVVDTTTFNYSFPQHMLDFLRDDNHQLVFTDKWNELKLIKFWFDKYCNDSPMRKKALFLYSAERSLGKTTFAKSLVGDCSCRYIYNRVEVDGNEFKNKAETGKLVILDDLKFQKDKKEMYKGLMAGEPVTIRSCYIQYFFDRRVPCIFLTNDYQTFRGMLLDKEYRNDGIFVSINNYLGPPGTEPEDRMPITNVDLNNL